jgi:hypothetical protein
MVGRIVTATGRSGLWQQKNTNASGVLGGSVRETWQKEDTKEFQGDAQERVGPNEVNVAHPLQKCQKERMQKWQMLMLVKTNINLLQRFKTLTLNTRTDCS